MPTPRELRLRKHSRVLVIEFDDQQRFELSAEYLRVYSPSAEVKGHGPGEEVLQLGKESVGIDRIEPVGHYAVRLIFDDGHDSGIYSWDYLFQLGKDMPRNWQKYLMALEQAGYERHEVD